MMTIKYAVEPIHGDFLGKFTNKWRQRTVSIFEHLDDSTKVVTIGVPIDLFDETPPVICEESKADYESTLQKIADAEANGRTYVYE